MSCASSSANQRLDVVEARFVAFSDFTAIWGSQQWIKEMELLPCPLGIKSNIGLDEILDERSGQKSMDRRLRGLIIL